MVFINLAFVLDELTDARWPVDFVVAKCGQGFQGRSLKSNTPLQSEPSI